MVERLNVVSISLFKWACCHAYVVFYAICVACSDCGLVNYVLKHAFFLERACFLVPTSAWVSGTPERGGAEGQAPPLPFPRGGKGANVPF